MKSKTERVSAPIVPVFNPKPVPVSLNINLLKILKSIMTTNMRNTRRIPQTRLDRWCNRSLNALIAVGISGIVLLVVGMLAYDAWNQWFRPLPGLHP
jgi:hypothetical protein